MRRFYLRSRKYAWSKSRTLRSKVEELWMEFKQRELPISVEQDTQGEQLAFITGFDKSGTTWMRDMFDAHPQIYCKSSGQFFDYHEPEQHFLAKQGGYRDIVNAVLGLRWYSMSGHTWVRKSGVEQMARALILRAMLAHGKGSNVRLILWAEGSNPRLRGG